MDPWQVIHHFRIFCFLSDRCRKVGEVKQQVPVGGVNGDNWTEVGSVRSRRSRSRSHSRSRKERRSSSVDSEESRSHRRFVTVTHLTTGWLSALLPFFLSLTISKREKKTPLPLLKSKKLLCIFPEKKKKSCAEEWRVFSSHSDLDIEYSTLFSLLSC